MKEAEGPLLEEIVRGAQLIFENAEALYKEAQLLETNGAFAGALTLHQISMEECSKVDMLGAERSTFWVTTASRPDDRVSVACFRPFGSRLTLPINTRSDDGPYCHVR